MPAGEELTALMRRHGTAICRLPGKPERWGIFSKPSEIITAMDCDEVIPALSRLDQLTRRGRFAAGFIAYEAAPTFDPAFRVNANAAGFPLLWFGVYPDAPALLPVVSESASVEPATFTPRIDLELYRQNIEIILQHIADGDIYQANYTIRTSGSGVGDPARLFLSLFHSHPVPYAAWLNTGEIRLASLSPELFFEKTGSRIHSSPMKGTAPRERTAAADHAAALALAADAKNRAENLMITDMVRNDLGRICRPGTITVKPLFHVDTYRTVHQMISTVHGEIPENMPLADIFRALFPAASITGAPKIRAMEIISRLEASPRLAYTGTVGCVVPGGDACFNVAIRTLIDNASRLELSVGAGIVADSTPESEWNETLLKSRFAADTVPDEDFSVLETMFYSRRSGVRFFAAHLERAAASQHYFGRCWDRRKVIDAVNALHIGDAYARIRLTVNADGEPGLTVAPLSRPGWNKPEIRVGIAEQPGDPGNLFLYHKTTRRKDYDAMLRRAALDGFDEMLWVNRDGELTEGCISSIFLKIGNKWKTPSLKCGLLPGIWRAAMIRRLGAEETRLTLCDLAAAETVIMGNSVRGGVRAGIIR